MNRIQPFSQFTSNFTSSTARVNSVAATPRESSQLLVSNTAAKPTYDQKDDIEAADQISPPELVSSDYVEA
eukprot:gene14438-15982_t